MLYMEEIGVRKLLELFLKYLKNVHKKNNTFFSQGEGESVISEQLNTNIKKEKKQGEGEKCKNYLLQVYN